MDNWPNCARTQRGIRDYRETVIYRDNDDVMQGMIAAEQVEHKSRGRNL